MDCKNKGGLFWRNSCAVRYRGRQELWCTACGTGELLSSIKKIAVRQRTLPSGVRELSGVSPLVCATPKATRPSGRGAVKNISDQELRYMIEDGDRVKAAKAELAARAVPYQFGKVKR